MLASVIQKIKLIPSYLYRNYAAPKIYSFRDREILSRNKELKNKFIGQRCFIIGGGPSVANVDLAKLKNEYTFVVNEFDRNSQYAALSPKFHLISDSQYYAEDLDSHWLERFKEKSRDIPKERTMLFNLAAKPFIEKGGLFQDHNVFYIGTQGIMSDKLPFSIELDRYVPIPKNSILLCLISAYYMGFSEVYLLGCEHNFLTQRVVPGEFTIFQGHSYVDPKMANLDLTDAEAVSKYTLKKDMYTNYEDSIANILQLFKNYRFFYKKARQTRPDFTVVNATPNSFLDVFPAINFENIKL